MQDILIRKKRKIIEKFDEKKLRKSLTRSGATLSLCKKVLNEIRPLLTENITSTTLHNLSLKCLRKHSKVIAANYHIKRGIGQLGPSGYPFEILCSELLKMKGFKTQVGITVKGQFVSHEIDVYGKREDATFMAECKFHNSKSHRNDVKIPLYIHSRAMDVKNNPKSLDFDTFLILSNTCFSKDAIKYAEGVGLVLISMNHPQKDTFVDHIKRYKVYPITCLKSLRKADIHTLLDKKIVVIKQLQRRKEVMYEIGLDDTQVNEVLREIKLLRQKS